MIILLVLAACLLNNSFGSNSFQVCHDAEQAFDGFNLSGNDNIARREKSAFFENADCNGDDIISRDEFSCKWKNSPVDMEPFFQLIDGDNDREISFPNYQEFLQNFDLNDNGRIHKEEFAKFFIKMILDYDIELMERPAIPVPETEEK